MSTTVPPKSEYSKSEIPKTDARRRAVSVLALKLWEVAEALEDSLDDPAPVLELLVNAVAKGEQADEAWSRLHRAATRHEKVGELALAYEQLAADKRIKLLPGEQQALIYLHGADFFQAELGDTEGAIGYAERAAAASPAHTGAFQALEQLYARAGKNTRLAELYLDASSQSPSAEDKLALLQKASELVRTPGHGSDDWAIEVGKRVLRLAPDDDQARAALVERLLARGRHGEVADVLEHALRLDLPILPASTLRMREQLVELALGPLKDVPRALSQIESLLSARPTHEGALAAAEALLEHRAHAPRAAAALSDAYERAGRTDRAIAMLSFEMKQVRGARRIEVQRRLGILRQDVLGDPAGALELLGPVLAGDPGNDELRARFVALSLGLNQPEQAARLLARALSTSRDPLVRARVGVDVGRVYSKSGDLKRAKAAFQQVLDLGGRGPAEVSAARELCELYTETAEQKPLVAALSLVAELETEPEARQAAARRLARLCDGDVKDPARAIIAWRALIGSPWTDEALRRLEPLVREVGDEAGLAEVLFQRAERSRDPEEARALALSAAELATERGRNPEAALALWQKLISRYGVSPELNRRLIPLLLQAKRYAEAGDLIEREIAWTPPEERPRLWLELAELRMSRLADPGGALRAYQALLEVEPDSRPARTAVEQLLKVAETRELAANILEPVLRREPPTLALLRVLEVQAELAHEIPQRLALLREASDLSLSALGDRERALELSGIGLAVALRGQRETAADWLARTLLIAEHVSSAQRAAVLLRALGDDEIDRPELFELAQAAGEAFAAAGDLQRAVELFRRALGFDPGSRALVARVDQLLVEQGAPEERLSLYRHALEQEAEPAPRRELLLALASLQARELGDVPGALATLEIATTEDPRDRATHEAKLELLTRHGDSAGSIDELSRFVGFAEGERKVSTLRHLAESYEERGEPARALERYRELCQSADLSDAVLDRIERLARDHDDGGLVRTTLEHRLARTADSRERTSLLERLGEAYALQLAQPDNAVRAWLEAAEIAEQLPSEAGRARRLYERVLAADAKSERAAERVIELAARAGDWAGVREAFEVVLPLLDERDLLALLLGLEERADSSDASSEYAALIDLAFTRSLTAARARPLELSKARALSRDPKNAARAAQSFRHLIERAPDDAEAEREAFAEFLQRTEPDADRADDFRWLMGRNLDASANPAELLFNWALLEEQRFAEPARALRLLERMLTFDAERADGLFELARLRAHAGDAKGAAQAFEELLPRADAEAQPAILSRLAALYMGPLAEPEQALGYAERVLAMQASDTEALRIVHQALAVPAARARAAALLERIAEGSDDPSARADVIEALLAVASADPELAEARSRWMRQLLATKLDEPEPALRLSLRGAEAAPGEEELWTIAEDMARKLGTPAPVSEAYARTIERELPSELAEVVGRRVVEFQEEWFDDPERVVELLRRVIELSPQADWAFDRLKLSFNSQGRYAELFALYDARLNRLQGGERIDLLREAAMAARDFAGDAERAIHYFEHLHREHPRDQRVEASLERLYERHGKKRPLIALLSARLEGAEGAAKSELLGRISALWLDLLELARALELAVRLLELAEGETVAVQLLERIIELPELNESAATPSERIQAARRLREHYRSKKSLADVVRMLEVEADGSPVEEQVSLLEEAVELRLGSLGDALGAFDTLAIIVALSPAELAYRNRLGELAETLGLRERRVAVLEQVAAREANEAVRGSLLLEAGKAREEGLADVDGAAVSYRGVLELTKAERNDGLAAARALSEILRGSWAVAEFVSVLERLAALSPAAAEQRLALGEAAEVSLAALDDPSRAITQLEARLALGADDAEAVDALCRALERAGRARELVEALERRADLAPDEAAARADRLRAAELRGSALSDARGAITAFTAVRTKHGRAPDLFSALEKLLTAEHADLELAALYDDEIAAEPDAARRQRLQLELGQLHEQRTGNLLAALEAFVVARDWPKAIHVAGLQPADPALGFKIIERLRQLAVEVYAAEELPDALASADWAVQELTSRLLERGEFARVVRELLSASALPFSLARRRELRRDAACLSSDRLDDAASAIELFQALLREEPSDDVAGASVTRLSLLLEEQGRNEEIVQLWEAQARARHDRGDAAGAALLYARAGEHAEARLGNQERALLNHRAGAELGGEAALEALARIHRVRLEPAEAARALERLLERDNPELVAERALELLQIYRELAQPARARAALEHAARQAIEGQPVRAALAALYRELADHAALAALLGEEAQKAGDRRARVALLREAAEIHLGPLLGPAAAAPLLAQAIELEPDDQRLRLRLAQALQRAGSHERATAVLREQIQRYGTRKPKDRALAHLELGRALSARGEHRDALVELDAAASIDPAHPGIMLMLGRLAMAEDDLVRAERMFRSLLLVVARDDDPDAPGKTEAFLSLSEIAARRGDQVRAGEFVESAFEASLESEREARALESALQSRGRPDLLARALENRSEQAVTTSERARLLAELVRLYVELEGQLGSRQAELAKRAAVIEQALTPESGEGADAAWAALGRVYGELGDTASEARVLERRIAGGSRGDADLYYRLARVKLAQPENVGEGLDLLSRGLDLGLEAGRARSLLEGASFPARFAGHGAELGERVARALGDSRALATALVRKLAQPGATFAWLEELIAASRELDDESLLAAGLDSLLDNQAAELAPRELAEARLMLARICRARGELARSFDLREASLCELSEAEAGSAWLELAKEAESTPGERARAVRLYRMLRKQAPHAAELWAPLSLLLRAEGDRAGLLELLSEVTPEVADLAERTELRLERVSLLRAAPGQEDASIAALFELLSDAPGHLPAVLQLRELLLASGRDAELTELVRSELDRAKDQRDVSQVLALSAELAELFEAQADFQAALDVHRAALDWAPAHPELLRQALRVADKVGDPATVAEALEALLTTESGATAAALARRLAGLREQLGDAEGAERALEASFAANPRDSALRDLLILRYTEREEHERASALLRISLAQRPDDGSLLERLVDAYRAAEQPEAALHALDRFLESSLADAALLRKRALLLGELGRDVAAVDALETAYSVDSALAPDLIDALERAIARAEPPEDRRFTLRLVELLESVGDVHGARARLSEFVREEPSDIEALRRLGELSLRAGGGEQSLATLSRLVELESGDALVTAALLLADVCEQLGQTARARSGLERALRIDPSRPDVRQRLQTIYAEAGAQRELAQLLFEDGENARELGEQRRLLLRAGQVALQAEGQAPLAARILERLRAQDPDNLEAIILLARAYRLAERSDAALSLLTSTAEANRGKRGKLWAQLYQEIASLHLADGFLSDGLAALGRAFELDPKNGTLAMELGLLALETDDDEIAQRAFRGLTIMKSPDRDANEGASGEMKAEANFRLALLARKQGDPRKAKVLVSKALAENAEHAAARALLAEL